MFTDIFGTLGGFTSFILTMWYVNNNIIDNIKKSLTSFILTMWYVNILGWCNYL